MTDEDDVPQLSAHALAALQEFYAERIQAMGSSETTQDPSKQQTIEEDWQLSQFWYDDRTSQILAEEALKASNSERIACISCPTLYSKLISIKPPHCQVTLLEFDRRFEKYGNDFIFYDYNKPLELPGEIERATFDLVVADPPYLSEECLTKTAETMKFLTKHKILLCTGAVLENLAHKLLGVKTCVFIPTHARNLGNEFRCYANYETALDHIDSVLAATV